MSPLCFLKRSLLIILRTSNSKSANLKWNEVDWCAAESILVGTEADVLAIFDCCHAGYLCQPRRGTQRRYGCLGACSAEQYTHQLGKTSFTSALIWALEQLRKPKECWFPLSKLQQQIMKYLHLPPNQISPMGHRTDASTDHIIVAPISTDDDAVSERSTDEDEAPTESFDVRFHFSCEITDELIINVAEVLSNVTCKGDLNRIPAD